MKNKKISITTYSVEKIIVNMQKVRSARSDGEDIPENSGILAEGLSVSDVEVPDGANEGESENKT
jgi:hypothetical protein